jgi:peptidoglycan/xylan/chitin deacetylase (PgdA/CDA1 family)
MSAPGMTPSSPAPVSRNRRTVLADVASRTGVTWASGLLPTKASLIVLTYHRVCDPAEVDGDRAGVSATPLGFERQVAALKRGQLPVVGLEEAIAHVRSTRSRGSVILMTFDDGYLDNYQIAFPILRNAGLAATFFLTTEFVGTSSLPWWDRIAYVVRQTDREELRLPGEQPRTIGRTERERIAATRVLLRRYKQLDRDAATAFLTALEKECAVTSFPAGRRFLNWEEARLMAHAGMDLGGHTHTHPVLTRIPPEAQFQELSESKRILEERLGRTITACAYPVGSPDAFDSVTTSAARAAGYAAAFAFDSRGLNRAGRSDLMALTRLPVDADLTCELLRLRLTVLSTTGQLYL